MTLYARPQDNELVSNLALGKSTQTRGRIKALQLSRPPDFEALRKARDNIILPAKDRKTKMKYVGETRTRKPAGKEDIHHERNGSGPKRRRKVVDRGRKQGEHKLRLSDGEAGEHQPGYKRHYHEQDAESEGAELEEKGSDAIDGGDAQVTTPTVLLPRPTKRRSETSNERRPSRHNLSAQKQGQIPRRRQSEPIEPVRYIRLNSSAVGRSQTTPILRYIISKLLVNICIC